MKTEPKTVTRFAPSPTGFLTLGNYRTALINYVFSKQHDGKFILRSEDTDTERSKKEYEDDILESFSWLGLTYDAFYRQSDRSEIYKKHLQKLLDNGMAYISKEAAVKEGQRGEVIRFKNPNKKITFTDLVRGEVTFDTTELNDFVIAKSLTEPIFHFAVVVDDFEMEVTHIIRGEDHISNTPRQILIQEALGAPRPIYAHLPLILAPDKSKLSKRNGAISIKDVRQEGFLPEAIINFLILLGWHPTTDQEILTLDEIVAQFDLAKVQKGGAVFDKEKLSWINKEYLRRLPPENLAEIIQKRLGKTTFMVPMKKLLPIILDRAEILSDIDNMVASGELDFAQKDPTVTPTILLWKEETKESALKHLIYCQKIFEDLDENSFETEKIKSVIWGYAEKEGRGAVLWPLRVALSGKEKSPDPFSLAALLGKNTTIARLSNAIKTLS